MPELAQRGKFWRSVNIPKATQVPMRLLKWEKSLGSPIGDKSNGGIFDNRKIKKFVPYYPCEVDWAEGLYRFLTQFESHP